MIITLKDGSSKEYANGMTVLEIAKDLSEGLARVTLGAIVDGKVVEANTALDKDCSLQILTFKDSITISISRLRYPWSSLTRSRRR